MTTRRPPASAAPAARACVDCGEPVRKTRSGSERCRVCAARASLVIDNTVSGAGWRARRKRSGAADAPPGAHT